MGWAWILSVGCGMSSNTGQRWSRCHTMDGVYVCILGAEKLLNRQEALDVSEWGVRGRRLAFLCLGGSGIMG